MFNNTQDSHLEHLFPNNQLLCRLVTLQPDARPSGHWAAPLLVEGSVAR